MKKTENLIRICKIDMGASLSGIVQPNTQGEVLVHLPGGQHFAEGVLPNNHQASPELHKKEVFGGSRGGNLYHEKGTACRNRDNQTSTTG